MPRKVDLNKLNKFLDRYLPDLDEVKQIIEQIENRDHNIDIYSFNSTDASKFQIAAILGEDQLINDFIINGFEVDFQSKRKITALHLAVFFKNNEIVRILLENGADPNKFSQPYFDTPFQMAIANGNMFAVEIMLDYGAHLDSKINTGASMLHLAIKKKHVEIAKYLMKKGVEVNTFDNVLKTPLHLAASCESTESIKALLVYGANVNAGNYDKNTALHISAYRCHMEAMNILMKSGASLTLKNQYDKTPFEACLTPHSTNLLQSETKIAQKALTSFAYNLHTN